MHQVLINEERCKGCLLCTVACPKDVLAQSARFNQQGYKVVEVARQDDCTACAACARICPDFAIRVFRMKSKKSTPAGGEQA
ncbi:4Fe-4S dicluster domain-containing protein [Megalodesulfovibrio paquesii]